MFVHCVNCRKPFVQGENVFTEAGQRETQISGMCESCFDMICAEVEEDVPDDADPYGGWETGPDFEDGF